VLPFGVVLGLLFRLCDCSAVCYVKPLSWSASMCFSSSCIDDLALSSIFSFSIAAWRSLLSTLPCSSSSDGCLKLDLSELTMSPNQSVCSLPLSIMSIMSQCLYFV
jgi:hypothetical protein